LFKEKMLALAILLNFLFPLPLATAAQTIAKKKILYRVQHGSYHTEKKRLKISKRAFNGIDTFGGIPVETFYERATAACMIIKKVSGKETRQLFCRYCCGIVNLSCKYLFKNKKIHIYNFYLMF